MRGKVARLFKKIYVKTNSWGLFVIQFKRKMLKGLQRIRFRAWRETDLTAEKKGSAARIVVIRASFPTPSAVKSVASAADMALLLTRRCDTNWW
jgi:hypothetical protein